MLLYVVMRDSLVWVYLTGHTKQRIAQFYRPSFWVLNVFLVHEI
jgi:hypothetical protein